MQEKYKHIFGLSRTFEGEVPEGGVSLADITESESGYFLDEREGFNPAWLDLPFDASKDGFYFKANQSRRNALLEIETDILVNAFEKAKAVVPAFYGSIGQDTYSGLANVGIDDVSLSLKRRKFYAGSASIKLKRIGLLLDSNATVQVHIPSINQTFEVVAAANTPSYNIIKEDIRIPLNGEPLVITYNPGEANPLNNLVSCGCGLLDAKLERYLENVVGQAANGLILDVQIDCDPSNVIDKSAEQHAPFFRVLAAAAAWKTAELLIKAVLADTAINRTSMVDRDHLKGRQSHFAAQYATCMNWLTDPEANSIQFALDPCYSCSNASGLAKVGIAKTY